MAREREKEREKPDIRFVAIRNWQSYHIGKSLQLGLDGEVHCENVPCKTAVHHCLFAVQVQTIQTLIGRQKISIEMKKLQNSHLFFHFVQSTLELSRLRISILLELRIVRRFNLGEMTLVIQRTHELECGQLRGKA